MPYQLVVISGLPAAGKSTLSNHLSRDLGVPVISRDRLRHAVFGPFSGTSEARDLVQAATTAMVMANLETFAAAREPLILDGNFNVPEHGADVRDLIDRHRLAAIEVCLWADTDVLRARFIQRADPPLTDELTPYFERVLHRPREPVLRPPAPVLEVDTTDFRALESDYPRLLMAIQRGHT